MTFTQFTAFAAVAKHLNVTKVANSMHVSQPSLSKHLKALEENFKLRLFTRHSKGIKLTDEGDSQRAMSQHSKYVLDGEPTLRMKHR
jgi:LysR family transcriptional regulator, low CO2-responsive transcriptional regulator